MERYIEEIRQYNSIMNLQYLPSEAEIRLIIENCPVCIDGEATEQEEVSGHRNSSGWRQMPYGAAWRSLSGKA